MGLFKGVLVGKTYFHCIGVGAFDSLQNSIRRGRGCREFRVIFKVPALVYLYISSQARKEKIGTQVCTYLASRVTALDNNNILKFPTMGNIILVVLPSENLPANRKTTNASSCNMATFQGNPTQIHSVAGGDSHTNYGPEVAQNSSQISEQIEKQFFATPLFMRSLDDLTDETNDAFEALKALAYEGEPHEVARNFKQQGNECYQAQNWKDAIEFYTKALAAKCSVDEINSACYANRAACNLELRNYRRAIFDCFEALKINPRNIKAWYRSARACLALDRLHEAEDCVQRGLAIDPKNTSLKTISLKINGRKQDIAMAQRARLEREQALKEKEDVLKKALLLRNITQRSTSSCQLDLPADAEVRLENPLDPDSILHFPLVILYPLHLESDFIKSVPESETMHFQLEEILSASNPPPWDRESEYTPSSVEILVEKKKYDIHGQPSLNKLGKNTSLRKALQEGKLELIDGVLCVFVVPKLRLSEFINDWKQRNPV
ncbi:hypothetical protein TWF694_011896 [Orbilia ellipsospora]|uniref:Cns1/TTC4 wheel domain-containing protein n=1 Tax=Orbilia ellipsospora TaxID=2528407 RepID=A0AAV9X6L7_9PEZI